MTFIGQTEWEEMQRSWDHIITLLPQIKQKANIKADLTHFIHNEDQRNFHAFSSRTKGIVGRVYGGWKALQSSEAAPQSIEVVPQSSEVAPQSIEAPHSHSLEPSISLSELKAQLADVHPSTLIEVQHRHDGITQLTAEAVLNGDYDHDIKQYHKDETWWEVTR